MITRKTVFRFWAVLDLFYLVRFIWLNISQQRIPLYDDIVAFNHYLPQQGTASIILFCLSIVLTLSIPVSAGLLFKQHRLATWLAYAQTPLRLLLVVPSLAFLPWALKTLDLHNAQIALGLLIISEVLKVWTLYRTR
ncbi:arginine:ornithine antiporter [Serratia microhaemolytica]|uniref:arginine:ornithine antiporter n=1 Tax=Serratia microhaemolytica TaxID=2675110 RepID=UPI000FDD8C43|nr:arginine:ornithine antiporter [Serratia microhaemolytica]